MDYDELYRSIRDDDGHKLILGPAGYGKSHLIQRLWNEGVKDILYCAPTGMAALNMHGVTIHSLFNFKPCVIIPEIEVNEMTEKKKKLLIRAKTLLIDECSMIRYDVFYAMDMILRDVRGVNKPFGGINLVLIGDLFQLSTVCSSYDLFKLWKLYPETKDTRYLPFFYTPVFRSEEFQSGLRIYELKHNFRQQNDCEYATRLMELRQGFPTDETLKYFNSRYIPNTELRFCLTPRVLTVNHYNRDMYDNLEGREWTAEPYITKYSKNIDERISACPIAKDIKMKIGMPIMFVLNDTKEVRRFVNGTFGTIVDVIENGHEIETVMVETNDKGQNNKAIEVNRIDSLIHEPGLDKTDNHFKYKYRAKINNFPFIPAWALTVHRAQGQTLKNYQVDLEMGGHFPFIGYVAMSRGCSLEDITLRRKLRCNDFYPMRQVFEFYNSLSPKIIPVTYNG